MRWGETPSSRRRHDPRPTESQSRAPRPSNTQSPKIPIPDPTASPESIAQKRNPFESYPLQDISRPCFREKIFSHLMRDGVIVPPIVAGLDPESFTSRSLNQEKSFPQQPVSSAQDRLSNPTAPFTHHPQSNLNLRRLDRVSPHQKNNILSPFSCLSGTHSHSAPFL